MADSPARKQHFSGLYLWVSISSGLAQRPWVKTFPGAPRNITVKCRALAPALLPGHDTALPVLLPGPCQLSRCPRAAPWKQQLLTQWAALAALTGASDPAAWLKRRLCRAAAASWSGGALVRAHTPIPREAEVLGWVAQSHTAPALSPCYASPWQQEHHLLSGWKPSLWSFEYPLYLPWKHQNPGQA